MAGVILSTARTGATTHIAVEAEESRVVPYVFEGVVVQVACLKLGGLEEGTGIDFAFGANTTGGSSSAADIETRQFMPEGVKMEERIGG